MKDNRNYVWSEDVSTRPEYSYIEHWITDNARVIDSGCGNGSLLALLKEKKRIYELGIEISQSGVDSCLKKGIKATFPNFAYLLNRLELLFKRRMPRRLLGGYNWYNTGHIHQFSIKDFKGTITNLIGLKIKDCCYYGGIRKLNSISLNLLAAGAIFLTEKIV
jgi:SAM-dependent methyltransferase